MKLTLYTTALLSLLLVSLGLQAQTTSATPPDASKHASSTNYTEGDIYYVKQLPSGQYTGIIFDVEGNEYPVATFKDIWWTTWNMRSKTYSDGVVINDGVPSATNVATDAQFCYPQLKSDNIQAKPTDYWDKSQGLLYNHKAAVNKYVGDINEEVRPHEVRQGICPSGWHVPSNMECTDLIATLGGFTVVGTLVKSATRLAGATLDTDGTSASADMGGFNLLLVGDVYAGSALDYGSTGCLWCSSSYYNRYAWYMVVVSGHSSSGSGFYVRYALFPVRCKKD